MLIKVFSKYSRKLRIFLIFNLRLKRDKIIDMIGTKFFSTLTILIEYLTMKISNRYLHWKIYISLNGDLNPVLILLREETVSFWYIYMFGFFIILLFVFYNFIVFCVFVILKCNLKVFFLLLGRSSLKDRMFLFF